MTFSLSVDNLETVTRYSWRVTRKSQESWIEGSKGWTVNGKGKARARICTTGKVPESARWRMKGRAQTKCPFLQSSEVVQRGGPWPLWFSCFTSGMYPCAGIWMSF